MAERTDRDKVEPKPGARRTLIIVGVVAGLVVVAGVAAALLLLGGGDDDGTQTNGGLDFAEPAELSSKAKADLAAALAALPPGSGTTDGEKARSVLGPPDIFQLWFEARPDGGVTRSETWFYLDLEVSYEFRDGALLFTIPMEEVGGLLLVPLRFDPLNFDETTTLSDVRSMLDDGAALVAEEIREEYGLGVTVWAGEQLMAAFDSSGELLYVETVALELGGAE